jgi:hypothetical protein
MIINSKRVVVVNLCRQNSQDAITFDRKFWSDAGPEARFSAAWEMVKEVSLFRGEKDVRQSRLQRSVCTFQQRKS